MTHPARNADRALRPRQPTLVRRAGPETETLLTPEEEAAHQTALDATLKVLGGKTGLFDTLSVASEVPEVQDLLQLMLDPRYDRTSLRRLCTLAGLTVVDLFTAYRKALQVKVQLQAFQVVADKILPVVEDVMQRAAPYRIPCPDCGAKGQVWDSEAQALADCATCAGQKELLQYPDLDRQKLALELAHLVQKAGGLQISQQVQQVQQLAGEAEDLEGPGTLIQLQHTLRALQGPRTPLPEPAPEAPAEPAEPDPPAAPADSA